MQDEVFYSEPFVTITYIDSWYIQNLNIFTPLYFQAVAYWEPKELRGYGPFSKEPCVTLAYSELEGYSEPSQISIMENFVQNHV